MSQPTYLALLEDDDTVISKPSIELIQAIPEPVKFIIRKDYHDHVKWGLNEATLYSYNAVDGAGKLKCLELPNFIFLDLGTDKAGQYTNERKIVVKEKHTGIKREFPSNSQDKHFLRIDLIRLYNRLNNVSSWAVLDLFDELDKIKKENEQLKLRVKQLEG